MGCLYESGISEIPKRIGRNLILEIGGRHIFNKISKLILFALILAGVASLISDNRLWRSFLDCLFIVALFLLMAGGSMFVLKGGIFDGILYSFRRFYKNTSKLEEYVSKQSESIGFPTKNESFKYTLTYPLLFSGGILFIITLIGALI